MKNRKIKQRVIWAINPVTRTIPSKKDYSRTKAKVTLKNEINRLGDRT